MAAKVKKKIRDPMKELELRDSDRKRYEDWVADKKMNKPHESFVRVGSTLSMGRKHRFWCDKQQRIVELMSDGELRAYKHLIWRHDVVAIEEQYALNPTITFKIAKQLGVVHPYSYKQHIHHIMSTDFLVTTMNEDGVCVQHAYPYKPFFDVSKPSRTAQKLRIETEYWAMRNVPCSILTNKDINKEWFLTLLFCELHYDRTIQFSRLSDFSSLFIELYKRDPWSSLRELLKKTARLCAESYFEAERLFKNAVLQGLLPLAKERRIRLNEALLLG